MRRGVLWLSALLLLGALGYAGYRYADERRFAATPFGAGTKTVQLAPGTGPHGIARLLAEAGVVSDADRFYVHTHYFRRGRTPRAGEYEFELPLTPDAVLGKLVRGEVKLYRFTVPEGLRADEIAAIVGDTSVCSAPDFLALARSAEAAHKLGVPGRSLEGYLFPDTYSFPRSAGCGGIAQAMVSRFRQAWHAVQAQRAPDVTLTEAEAVTLGSIIEKETGQADERPRISCVFHNRLRRRIPLATDPTVIYAVLLQNDFRWDGNLHRADLRRPHPYNTYLNRGLPPGPIANPGAAALAAALHPLKCDDLFFVSRNDHTHVFCPDLRCHERNVRKFQVEYFRRRRNG
ncbi:MAG TPA: endolytic transglycosylase MltG [Myxococcales bacterium]|nr:endolytic transglycosylase MltG [Myxococcales bacterium]